MLTIESAEEASWLMEQLNSCCIGQELGLGLQRQNKHEPLEWTSGLGKSSKIINREKLNKRKRKRERELGE